jgi:beta-1,4-mannooligosaccharide/beta-1,4-mannosyl-N-acetylglucosamine phosphorylase
LTWRFVHVNVGLPKQKETIVNHQPFPVIESEKPQIGAFPDSSFGMKHVSDELQTASVNSQVRRYEGNPLLSPEILPKPASAVFNSGVCLFEDRFVMLANIWDNEWRPSFHVAWSDDGISFEVCPEPAVKPLTSYPYVQHEGIFDTRITPIEGRFLITYNMASHLGTRIRLCATDDFQSFEDLGFITAPDHRNCVIFPRRVGGRYLRLERPNVGEAGDIYLSESPDLIHWGRAELVLEKGFRYWASAKVGPAAPPIETDEGWLVLFHAARKSMNGYFYSAGCMLLDPEDPTKVIGRMNSTLMMPEEPYEQNGLCPNVVFPTGVVNPGGEDGLMIYYGGGDRTMNLAFASKSLLIAACQAGS